MKKSVKRLLIVIALNIALICACAIGLVTYATNNPQTVKNIAKRLMDGRPLLTSKATNPPRAVSVSTAQELIKAQEGGSGADDEAAFEIVALDTRRIQDRFALPDLARMAPEERAELVDSTQVMRRIEAMGIDPEAFQTPEVEWKRIYNHVTGFVQKLSEPTESVGFDGGSVSELNALLKSLEGSATRVVVQGTELLMDETLVIPSGVYVDGGSVRLVPVDKQTLERAVLLDGVHDCALAGFRIAGGCGYGVFIKNSGSFVIEDNDISLATCKGIVMMGSGERFAIRNNHVHDNWDGGVFLNGGMRLGVLEGNRIVNNHGATNQNAGIALSGMEITDIDTAYNKFKDIHLYDITDAPNNLVLYDNTVARNQSSGLYSDSAYMIYAVDNDVVKNEKEGMCFDYGSFGNYIARNNISGNGGRNRMSEHDLKKDFVLELGRLSDGSSPAKLPGISLDNTAYNTIYGNVISMNYGSGIKAVRSAFRNVLLCNQVSDNNMGVSDLFHFFGIELSTDTNADKEVVGLDFLPCYENIVARNLVSGGHYAAVYLGEGGYVNDFFDNTFVGCTDWSMECLSDRYNGSTNNMSFVSSRGISLTNSTIAVTVAGRVD